MDCTIINFDEVSFRLVPFLRKIWAPIGTKPIGTYFWSNKKANMFGALIDGKDLFHQWYDRLNAHSFIDFLKMFIEYLPKNKKYIFILDNGPSHRAKITKSYLASLGSDYKIEFLPTYSPQLNAIETCWKIVRHDVTNSNLFSSIEELKTGVEIYLEENIFSLVPSNYLVR